MKTAFFTGHRNIDNVQCQPAIERMIDTAIADYGITHFISGMALGTDQLAAKVLCDRGLNWTAVLPCPPGQQYSKWHPWQKEQYIKLFQNANNVIVLYPQYQKGCLHGRNVWMVKHSQLCLAVYNGDPNGGTAATVKIAKERNLPIIQFNPALGKLSQPPVQLELKLSINININL